MSNVTCPECDSPAKLVAVECSCGATLTVEGENSLSREFRLGWEEAHKDCPGEFPR